MKNDSSCVFVIFAREFPQFLVYKIAVRAPYAHSLWHRIGPLCACLVWRWEWMRIDSALFFCIQLVLNVKQFNAFVICILSANAFCISYFISQLSLRLRRSAAFSLYLMYNLYVKNISIYEIHMKSGIYLFTQCTISDAISHRVKYHVSKRPIFKRIQINSNKQT